MILEPHKLKTTGPPNPDSQVISPALRKKLQQCYDHGTKLMQQEKYDFDYAHSMFVECVLSDPGNSIYVEAFLQNLQRKYNNNRRGTFFQFGGKGALKKAIAQKDWLEVLKQGPHVLKKNPWHVPTLRAMAEACAAFGFHEAELRYLKNALAPRPMDPAVNKHCAQSLARIGQFDQAIACWQRVDEARRGDEEAQRMISDLQIAKTLGHGASANSEASRRQVSVKGTRLTTAANTAAANTAAANTAAETTESQSPPPAEPVRREIKRTRRQDLEQDIANRPADIDAYLELAQHHVEEGRLAEAAHVLNKALAASGNRLNIQERIEDVEVLRRREQLAVAEKRAQAEASEASQQLVGQLRDDLHRMELEIFDRRAQRYPGDLELQFQLGLRLKRVGNFREAVKCFAVAQAVPGRRTEANLEQGECLQRLKQFDKALECYRVAAGETAVAGLEFKKLALYRWGMLAEGLKHWEAAEHGFAELTALDAHYKDAATRLDKLRAMRHNET